MTDADAAAAAGSAASNTGDVTIEVFWRPACPFCMYLEARMSHSELVYERHNIWDDAAAAEFVRSVANGNETVPTVRLTTPDHRVVGLVNPSLGEIREQLAALAA